MKSATGNIIFGANQLPPAGGVLTLDNGLTLTGTNGQLGGALIKNTNIALAGFAFSVTGSTGSIGLHTGGTDFSMTPNDGVNAYTNKQFIFLNNDGAGLFQIQNSFYSDNFQIANGSITYSKSGIGYFLADPTTGGIFYLGNNATSRQLYIDTINNFYTIGDPNIFYLKVNSLNKNQAITALDVSSNRFLLLDNFNYNYAIGDYDGAQGSTFVNANDANQVIILSAANGVQTDAPGGGSNFATFKIGGVLPGAVAIDTANYLETEINGITVKVLIAL